MFEISLVPDVKSELIKKLKLRNLIFLICIIVAAACGGVLLILGGITAGQGVALQTQDTEMVCRSEGKTKKGGEKDCGRYKETAIMRMQQCVDTGEFNAVFMGLICKMIKEDFLQIGRPEYSN